MIFLTFSSAIKTLLNGIGSRGKDDKNMLHSIIRIIEKSHSESGFRCWQVNHSILTLPLLLLAFFIFTSCSALLISSSVTPCVDRRVSRTRFACAFRCVSLSSSRVGGTKDLRKTEIVRRVVKSYFHKMLIAQCFHAFWWVKVLVSRRKKMNHKTVVGGWVIRWRHTVSINRQVD